MPLAVGQHLELFTSPNLKDWTFASSFGENDGSHGGVWECPDFFPIKASDGTEKWILIQNIGRGAVNGGSGTQYFVGHFDGKTFKNDNPPSTTLWLDYGADNYAGVTWFNAPNQDRIYIGWMSNWDDYAQSTPSSTWRSGMTVPRKLTLYKSAEGYKLAQSPVNQINTLRNSGKMIGKIEINSELEIDSQHIYKELIIDFDLEKSDATEIGFVLKNAKNEQLVFGYDKIKKEVFIDRTRSGISTFSEKFSKIHSAPMTAKNLKIRALIDNASIEVFVNDGKIALTDLFFPTEYFNKTTLYTKNGKAVLRSGMIYGLKRIWK